MLHDHLPMEFPNKKYPSFDYQALTKFIFDLFVKDQTIFRDDKNVCILYKFEKLQIQKLHNFIDDKDVCI